MALKKMVITAYKKDTFDEASKTGTPFTVMINPASYTHKYKICYNNRQVQGDNGGSPEFNKIAVDRVNFELIFDGTGVLPTAMPGILPSTEDGIADTLQSFRELVFDYTGDIHSPKYLKLTWGTFVFQCRLESMDLTYTLFMPDGTPLRAKAQLNFLGYTALADLARDAEEESPDMSHLVTVRAGDTLPLLCFRIYGDSRHYLEVARANNLSSVQALAAGARLLFPPLAAAQA